MLLDTIYDKLDFKSGSLHSATETPSSRHKNNDWIEKGEWITSAKKVGADKVFFVDNNPVIIFSKCGAGLEESIKVFNETWCLSRPRILFLASPGKITVYDLAQRPADITKKEDWKNLKRLAVFRDINKVSKSLQKFHRDNVESGHLFADKKFGDIKNRADKALIRDLKKVRRELISAGLSNENVKYAHALIGRSIFIRYLEDRGILTKDYFYEVAMQKTGWADLIDNPDNSLGLDFSKETTFYPRILANKGFTYALFKKLSIDFNGDMFPNVDDEEKVVTQAHVTCIQNLLYGDVGKQKKLFFYSYRFDIVPVDLISSIYEEFYHSGASDDGKSNRARMDGAYYTPSVLAEFVLSRMLTPDILEKNPRILDPACGSGIFLVEAFRRIVRFKWYKNKRALTFEDMKNILKEQISGIEVNDEAARITAFSLYLSMLHYLDPPAIDKQIKMGNKLPNLVATTSQKRNHFHCILSANAFDTEYIESVAKWKKRFGKESADIIVGNPPWGAPGTKADKDIKDRHSILLRWCKTNKKQIGDNEASQAFLWRTLDFLKKKGRAGMLVSAGVLFKHNTTTKAFRDQWFDSVRLNEIFNFAHVRKFFFKGGDSPFVSIFFKKEKQMNKPVFYWSAKQTMNIKKLQAVVLSIYDMHTLNSRDLLNQTIWKELWFGRTVDKRLLTFLRRQKCLAHYSNRTESGQGYTPTGKKTFLYPRNNLNINNFSRYDSLIFSDPPPKVYRQGKSSVYEGMRLLVKRGINEKAADKGTIIARYEKIPFCFTNAINGIKLKSSKTWEYKTVIGILWSSIARYFFFNTSSNWGLWHHEIHLDDELLQLPIVLDKSNPATKKVIRIVDKLISYNPLKRNIFQTDGTSIAEIDVYRHEQETKLNEAVFQLYNLNEEQKDLIIDFCDTTLPFFYKPFDSVGSMRAIGKGDLSWIKQYINIFCNRWNAYLGEDEKMNSEVHIGAHDNIIAIEFYPSDLDDFNELKINNDNLNSILHQIGKVLSQPMGTTQILQDGLVHVVSDHGIFIIKRNEKRFWTRSMAREDAEATLCSRMIETMPKVKGKS